MPLQSRATMLVERPALMTKPWLKSQLLLVTAGAHIIEDYVWGINKPYHAIS